MAQLEGASRLANYANRLHWDGNSYTQETSLATDPFFYHTSSISDSTGNLLYYSNGMRLYNAQNESVDLGVAYDKPNECLLFKLDTCYALVVVDVVDSGYHYSPIWRYTEYKQTYLRIYYLHTTPKDIYTAIYDSVVYEVPFAPFIEAVQHANGRDYWIALLQDTKTLSDLPSVRPEAPHYYRIARLGGDGSFDMGTSYPTYFHAYQGREKRDQFERFYSIGDTIHRIVYTCQAKFSPDGKYFVFADLHYTDIYQFDNENGTLVHGQSFFENGNLQENGGSWSKIGEDRIAAGFSYENIPGGENHVEGSYGANALTFEITGDNKLVLLYSCVSRIIADTFTKKWIYHLNDPRQTCNQLNEAEWARKEYYFSALASYDLSSADPEYYLVNKNAFLYYENCFDREDISNKYNCKTTSVNLRTLGGAFYDLQLMPDGNVYLINYVDEGGMSKLHTAGDSLRLEWIRDGNPTGFQGDAFSKVVGSYKLPGIKIFKDKDTLYCGEAGIVLSAKALGADSMQWSTGDKSKSILATQEGWYSVSANTWHGVVVDSVYLYSKSIVYTPMADTTKCPEIEMKLSPSGNFDSYTLYKILSGVVASVKGDGTYYISYTKEGCTINDTFEVLNHIWPEITVEQVDSGCLPAEEIHFTIEPDDFAYLWNGTTERTPFATRETSNILQIISEDNCVLDFNLQASENCLTTYFLPNGFTPNGDGLNDTWSPQGNGILNYSYSVYNRWGEKLVESEVNQPFDGRNYQMGFYLFVIQLTLKDSTVINEKELVFLLR